MLAIARSQQIRVGTRDLYPRFAGRDHSICVKPEEAAWVGTRR